MTEELKAKKPRAPRKPKEKVLDFNIIHDEFEKVQQYSTYKVEGKENLVIKYNEVFDELEIQDLITEVFEHLNLNDKLELGYFNNYAEFMAYVNFMIIKKFSFFKEQFNNSTLEQNIILMNELARVKYFKIFFEKVFEPEQVIKVYEAINERAELADHVSRLTGETKEQWDSLVKDTSVRNRLNLNN